MIRICRECGLEEDDNNLPFGHDDVFCPYCKQQTFYSSQFSAKEIREYKRIAYLLIEQNEMLNLGKFSIFLKQFNSGL